MARKKLPPGDVKMTVYLFVEKRKITGDDGVNLDKKSPEYKSKEEAFCKMLYETIEFIK